MIFRNAMLTPDGTIIESAYRHDYVTHKDANGETYMVDGGTDYFRRSVNEEKAQDLSVMSIDGDHDFNRKNFKWGTYGKDGTEDYHQVVLMDMSTKHILAVLKTQDHIQSETRKLFEQEIRHREDNK